MDKAVAHKMIGGGHQVTASKEDRTPTRRHVKRVSIERAANGGHVIEHHFSGGNGVYHEPQQHVFGPGDHEKAMEHVRKHMGINKIANMTKMNAGKKGAEPDADDAKD